MNPSLSPWRLVAVQALVGVGCSVAVWAATGRSGSGWSALYGAAAVVAPNAVLARGMTREARSPVAAAVGFMFWEALKIGVAIAMLALAAGVAPKLSWPALLVTMVVCMKANWFVLLRHGR